MTDRLARAATLLDLGRPAAARTEIAAVLATEPDNAWAMALLCRAAFAEEEYEESIRHARAALGISPRYEYAMSMLALGLINTGHGADAVATARELVELDPSCADHYRVLAVALRDTKAEQLALEAIDRAIELDPDSPVHHTVRGSILRMYRPRRSSAADAALREALYLDPEHVEAHLELALNDLASGRIEAGRRGLLRVAELDPSRAASVRARLALLDRRVTSASVASADKRSSMGSLVGCLTAGLIALLVYVALNMGSSADKRRQETPDDIVSSYLRDRPTLIQPPTVRPWPTGRQWSSDYPLPPGWPPPNVPPPRTPAPPRSP
ncbi:tetratricopeptide repeat protein [Nocardia sp. NPDC052566]|uniref:tetratricopeptide repeat protein n=1 Tax=Nocardia sp. NPDC052566 TaxID=3364330 RepID=UPI0037CB1F5A